MCIRDSLCVEAHGRLRLARLPAGTVQVLGAEKAFFSHLRSGTAPPKHGHIFMHPWISRSPRWVRGKIARMLAAKISIAARVDAFQGTPLGQEDVDEIEAKLRLSARNSPSLHGVEVVGWLRIVECVHFLIPC